MVRSRPARYALFGALLAVTAGVYCRLPLAAPIALAPLVIAFGLVGLFFGARHDLLETLASTDAATRLPNRRAFERRFAEAQAMAERHHLPLAILLLDVDGLKAINDTLGHAAGDQALRDVADALRQSLRVEDLAARWGGDEFIVIAPCTRESEGLELALRIRRALRATGSRATVSIGVAATESERGPLPAFLFEAADRALAAAKVTGRDRALGSEGRWHGWFDERSAEESLRLPLAALGRSARTAAWSPR